MRVLVVEDHELLARTIRTGPRREGMAVDVVLDGDDALEHLAVTRYDVVVHDRDLPGRRNRADSTCGWSFALHPHDAEPHDAEVIGAAGEVLRPCTDWA